MNLELALLYGEQSLASLFQRVNWSLTSLEISGAFVAKNLRHLSNLKELRFGGYTSINTDLSGCLKNNRETLEVLEMKFFHPDEDDHEDNFYSSEEVVEEDDNDLEKVFVLSPLPKLRFLRLENISHNIQCDPKDSGA